MPIYDLKCSKCGNEFSKMAKMDERTNKKILCPDCGNNELETIFKNVNIITSKKDSSCPNIHKCGGCCGH